MTFTHQSALDSKGIGERRFGDQSSCDSGRWRNSFESDSPGLTEPEFGRVCAAEQSTPSSVEVCATLRGVPAACHQSGPPCSGPVGRLSGRRGLTRRRWLGGASGMIRRGKGIYSPTAFRNRFASENMSTLAKM